MCIRDRSMTFQHILCQHTTKFSFFHFACEFHITGFFFTDTSLNSYKDVYKRQVLASEMDFIQSEVYKNSFFLGDRMDRILYYDCTKKKAVFIKDVYKRQQ